MKLEKINPPEPYFTATCVKCGNTVTSDTGLVDLNGEAFKSYYCPGCANKMKQAQAALNNVKEPTP